ncbi:retrovirus-related pol polyprotein from transposon TNT 1-94 [Tanacetum coccineum]
MSQDVMICVMNSIAVFDDMNVEMQSSESYMKCLDLDAELLNKQNAYNDLSKKYFKNNDLKAQLQAKDTTICKLKKHIKSMRENDKEEKVKHEMDKIETINIELEHSVAKLLSENGRLQKQIEHLKKIYKDQFDSIKKTRALSKEHDDSLISQLNSNSMENADLKRQIQDKVFVITSLKNDLRKLKGKETVENAAQIPIATTIAPGMFKIYLEPLAHRLLNNREAHIDYLKHTQEQADILQGLVESSKTPDSNTPVFSSTGLKCSTSTCRTQPTCNKKNDRISQTPSSNLKNKVEVQRRRVKSKSNKKNRVKDPICDANVKHTMLNANSELICVKCNQCMFDANHDACFLKFMNDMNVRSKSKSAKKREHLNIGKPTGKVFTEVRHKWKPTRRLFTIVGNSCPLTRITPKKIVHLKETNSNSVETPKPEIKVYSRRPKQIKSVGSSRKAKIIESKIANNSKPNHLWGSNAIDVPSSSSLVNDRLSRLSSAGNVIISRVYYVEGLGHNLFSVGQFCDVDMEVAFRKNTCFIRNLDGVDLLSRSRDTNFCTISLDDMLKTSPICLLSKASKTKSWLWHRRLSHLNFASALGKSKKSSHQPKAEDTNQEKLYLLHMDLYGPMRVESINGKKYILVIIDDYSRFTWVRFLRSKDEAPDTIIKGLKNIQVRLNATVRKVRTDNGTEFGNQTLRDLQNRTLVEAARTMLIFSKAPLFLWAEAINTACYTQNHSLIRLHYNKTPYELMHDKKPDLSFLHIFGSLYYPTNESEDLGKLNAKADIGIFVGYAPAKKAFRIYNMRTWKIMETIHVTFDELTAMASEQFGLGPGLQLLTPAISSSGLVTDIPKMDKNEAKLDKTEHGIGRA